MGRRLRKIRIEQIKTRIVPLSKRVISAYAQYEKLRADIEILPGDDPKRAALHLEAAKILKERNKVELEVTALTRELQQLGQTIENRENRNGKESKREVNDIPRDNLEST